MKDLLFYVSQYWNDLSTQSGFNRLSTTVYPLKMGAPSIVANRLDKSRIMDVVGQSNSNLVQCARKNSNAKAF